MINLAAYTAPGSDYPEFLSINKNEDSSVSITVRSHAKPGGHCGDTVMITVDEAIFDKLVQDLAKVCP